jgi:hypothetical protein
MVYVMPLHRHGSRRRTTNGACGADIEKGVDGRPAPTMTASGDGAALAATISQLALIERLSSTLDCIVVTLSAAAVSWS